MTMSPFQTALWPDLQWVRHDPSDCLCWLGKPMGAQLGKARLKRQSCTGTVQLHDNRRGAANRG